MRTGFLVALALLVAAPAAGQEVEVDSLEAFLDRDRDCDGFASVLEAQSHYRALQIVLSDSTADPHRLDADGNGVACEGLRYMRVIHHSADWWVRTVETVHSVHCGPLVGTVNVAEFSDKMEGTPFNQVRYLPTQEEAECLDTLFEIYDNAPP